MAKKSDKKPSDEPKPVVEGSKAANKTVEQEGIPRSGDTLAEFLINDERIAELLREGYVPGQTGSTRTNKIKAKGPNYVFNRSKNGLTAQQKIAKYKELRQSLIDSGQLPEVNLDKFAIYDPNAKTVVGPQGRKRTVPKKGVAKPPSDLTAVSAVTPSKSDTYRGFEIRKCIRPNGKPDVLTASEHLSEHLREQAEAGIPIEKATSSPEYLFWSHEPENWARMTEQQHLEFHADQLEKGIGDFDTHMQAANHWQNLIRQGYGTSGKIWQQTVKFTK